MNTVFTTILIAAVCFGTKLKIEEFSFKEIAPGVSTGYVITKYEVQVKSTGNKKATIEEVWLKNRMASWKLFDEDGKIVETIQKKGVYTLTGETKIRSAGAKYKSKSVPKESIGSFEEDFLVKYKIEGSDNDQCMSIAKIENLELVKMQ
ncbi:hypothetical protein [Reichenbachiella sp.]|uniref:hypothetical protein n=1 Tax=Reichenbachiella sp. TaxID=2184521 RepID=UPI003B595F5C